jgi:hypothetical protein
MHVNYRQMHIQDPDPDPLDLYVFWPPGSASESVIYLLLVGILSSTEIRKMKKNLDFYSFVTSLSSKNDVNVFRDLEDH